MPRRTHRTRTTARKKRSAPKPAANRAPDDDQIARAWWPPKQRQGARFVLVGCCGVPPARREHVFDVIDHCAAPAVHVGCMTAGRAAARFGIESLFMSASHGFCPDCAMRLDDPRAAEGPANTQNDPNSPGLIGLVWFLRRPATIEKMTRLMPGLARLDEDLAVLTQARYVSESRTRGRRIFVATARGIRACDAFNRRRITAVRRRFRGKKEM